MFVFAGSQALRVVDNYFEDATSLRVNTMNPAEVLVLTGNIFEGVEHSFPEPFSN